MTLRSNFILFAILFFATGCKYHVPPFPYVVTPDKHLYAPHASPVVVGLPEYVPPIVPIRIGKMTKILILPQSLEGWNQDMRIKVNLIIHTAATVHVNVSGVKIIDKVTGQMTSLNEWRYCEGDNVNINPYECKKNQYADVSLSKDFELSPGSHGFQLAYKDSWIPGHFYVLKLDGIEESSVAVKPLELILFSPWQEGEYLDDLRIPKDEFRNRLEDINRSIGISGAALDTHDLCIPYPTMTLPDGRVVAPYHIHDQFWINLTENTRMIIDGLPLTGVTQWRYQPSEIAEQAKHRPINLRTELPIVSKIGIRFVLRSSSDLSFSKSSFKWQDLTSGEIFKAEKVSFAETWSPASLFRYAGSSMPVTLNDGEQQHTNSEKSRDHIFFIHFSGGWYQGHRHAFVIDGMKEDSQVLPQQKVIYDDPIPLSQEVYDRFVTDPSPKTK